MQIKVHECVTIRDKNGELRKTIRVKRSIEHALCENGTVCERVGKRGLHANRSRGFAGGTTGGVNGRDRDETIWDVWGSNNAGMMTSAATSGSNRTEAAHRAAAQHAATSTLTYRSAYRNRVAFAVYTQPTRPSLML